MAHQPPFSEFPQLQFRRGSHVSNVIRKLCVYLSRGRSTQPILSQCLQYRVIHNIILLGWSKALVILQSAQTCWLYLLSHMYVATLSRVTGDCQKIRSPMVQGRLLRLRWKNRQDDGTRRRRGPAGGRGSPDSGRGKIFALRPQDLVS